LAGSPPRTRGWATWVGAALVGVVVLAVYRTTLLPGVGLWDTAEAQAVPVLGGTMHPTGFPAWVVLVSIFLLRYAAAPRSLPHRTPDPTRPTLGGATPS